MYIEFINEKYEGAVGELKPHISNKRDHNLSLSIVFNRMPSKIKHRIKEYIISCLFLSGQPNQGIMT